MHRLNIVVSDEAFLALKAYQEKYKDTNDKRRSFDTCITSILKDLRV